MKRVLSLNERGLRIGEDHAGAKITNREVDLLLNLRDEGWSYNKLAEKFEISKSMARYIIKGVWRCQTPVKFKTIYVNDEVCL